MIKIATWNLNSLTVRLEQLIVFLNAQAIDVIALQETKVQDAAFPLQALQGLGYEVLYAGEKSYNGVAILSRYPLSDPILSIPDFIDPQRRVLATTIEGIRVINVYVPNGGDLSSEKFTYKLNWLGALTAWIREELKRYPKLVVLGDFNIAPRDEDVFEGAESSGILVSEAERQAFAEILDLGLMDAFREYSSEKEQYTWWDYRAASFRRKRGYRIDHILISHALKNAILKMEISIEERKHSRPSDHAPVCLDLAGIH